MTTKSKSPVALEQTHATMHADHRNWLSEDAMWHDDIRAWQGELKKALADIKLVETALKEHDRALQTHAAANALHETTLREHEHALADFEQGGSGEQLIFLASRHLGEGEKHAQMRDAHERVKRHHHTVMAKWNLLAKSLGEAS